MENQDKLIVACEQVDKVNDAIRRRKESTRKYREANRELCKKRCLDHYHKNKERLNLERKEFKKLHPEIILKWNRDYRARHPERCQENTRLSNLRRRKLQNDWVLNKCKNDPNFKLSRSLSSRIRIAIKQRNCPKYIDKLVGCSSEFLRVYIESLWLDGMSWDNYGVYKLGQPMTWHIDHKRPLSSFDLFDPEQQETCFHYTNLQPLWAIDNIRKSDKLLP